MLVYGLRLLVALVTFGVGVAAASLLDFSRPAPSEKGVLVAAPAAPYAPSQQEEQPPRRPRSCGYVVSGGVLNGKAVSKPAPSYPPIAKAARASGTVTVEILVDESGHVLSATAISGHPLLQQAAVAAAREATFSPTRLSGQPVKVSGVVTYNFGVE
jgi:protein TonB